MTSILPTSRLRRAAAAAAAAAAAFAMTACGAGQISQTAEQRSAVDGAGATAFDRHVAVNNVLIVQGDEALGVPAGNWLSFAVSLDDASGAPNSITLDSVKVNGKAVSGLDAYKSTEIGKRCSLLAGRADEGYGADDESGENTGTTGTSTTGTSSATPTTGATATGSPTTSATTTTEMSSSAAPSPTAPGVTADGACIISVPREATKVAEELEPSAQTEVTFVIKTDAGKTETVTVRATVSKSAPENGSFTREHEGGSGH